MSPRMSRYRWVQHRRVTLELLSYVEEMLPTPKDPWYFRTRRGALYRAIPPFRHNVGQDETDLMTDTWSVVDIADRSVYLRPGTREWQRAAEALR